MTLLAELFDRLGSTPMVISQPQAGALVGAVERTAPQDSADVPPAPASPTPPPAPAGEHTAETSSERQYFIRTAATASPAWLAVRDQFHNHIFGDCPGCHPPTGRYCPTGAELRATYDTTPMEPTR